MTILEEPDIYERCPDTPASLVDDRPVYQVAGRRCCKTFTVEGTWSLYSDVADWSGWEEDDTTESLETFRKEQLAKWTAVPPPLSTADLVAQAAAALGVEVRGIEVAMRFFAEHHRPNQFPRLQYTLAHSESVQPYRPLTPDDIYEAVNDDTGERFLRNCYPDYLIAVCSPSRGSFLERYRYARY